MKFGLFYELQLPKPGDADQWDPDAERRIFHEMLDQVSLADSLGFDFVFEVEHHFLEEYSHSSAPELMMAALSQRTKNIRLGHGIVLTPPKYNHPARVAERISALDLLSNGRVEFGSGESASEMELGGFGVERGRKKAMWEEATREITNMMTHTPYEGFEGEFFSMPSRNVVPKPLQKPHPPLWVAASRRETTMVAARLGMGSLGFGFETPEELGERALEYYRLVREELMPIGHAINPGLAVLNTFMMADTDEEAMRRSANGPAFFSYSLGYYYNPAVGGNHKPGGTNVYRDFLARSEETAGAQAQRGGFLSAAEIASGEPADEIQKALYRAARSGNAIGTAETLRRTLMKYEEQHLDVMIFVAQCGDRKHEHIMESIERFGKQLLPEFKDRHEREHKAWRAEQLKGVDFPDQFLDLRRCAMAKAADVLNTELRGKLETAFAAMRAGRGIDAVRAAADAYLRFVELFPEVKNQTIAMRGRQVSRLVRWPALGANMSLESVRAGKPEIEFLRERFAVSEAMTYYQFVLDEVLEHQSRTT